MIVEGKSYPVPPARVAVELPQSVAVATVIYGRGCPEKYGADNRVWQRGLVNETIQVGPHLLQPFERSWFIGTMGELAVAEVINRRLRRCVATVDLTKRAAGDFGVDIELFGRRIQIKTRQSARQVVCVKAGRFKSDTFVLCEWSPLTSVEILGWLPTRDVESMQLVPTRICGGTWKNHEVPDSSLRPFGGLVDELRIQGDQQGWR